MSLSYDTGYEYRLVLLSFDSKIVRLAPQGTDLDFAHERLRAILDEAEPGYYWNGWIERRPFDTPWETFEAAMVPPAPRKAAADPPVVRVAPNGQWVYRVRLVHPDGPCDKFFGPDRAAAFAYLHERERKGWRGSVQRYFAQVAWETVDEEQADA